MLQARLAELYQSGGNESEQRVQDLLGAVEKIQALLEATTREKEELQLSLDEESFRCVQLWGHLYCEATPIFRSLSGLSVVCCCADLNDMPALSCNLSYKQLQKLIEVCFLLRNVSRQNELQAEVEGLKMEVSRANELVSSLRKRGGEVISMSPAAAKASALLKSGMTLTQIYSKYVEVGWDAGTVLSLSLSLFSLFSSPLLEE